MIREEVIVAAMIVVDVKENRSQQGQPGTMYFLLSDEARALVQDRLDELLVDTLEEQVDYINWMMERAGLARGAEISKTHAEELMIGLEENPIW